MVEVIVIVLMFGHLFIIIFGFAKQLFLIVYLSIWLDVWLRLALLSCRSQLLIHLAFARLMVLGVLFGPLLNWLFATLFLCDFGLLCNRSWLSLALSSSRLSSPQSNCTHLYVTILNCPWLHRAVTHWLCRVIMRDFGWSVRWLISWPCLCKLFLTIGSSNCKRFKTKSTLLIDCALASNYLPRVYLQAWTAEPSRVTWLPPIVFSYSLRFLIYQH